MTIVDWVMIACILLSVAFAAKEGLIVEVFSLGGLLLGLLLASWDYQRFVPWFGRLVHSIFLAEALAFLCVALMVMLAAGIAGKLLRSSVRSAGLGWADRIAGAGFGLVKGCALVTIAVMTMAAFSPDSTWLRQSYLAPGFLSLAHRAAAVAPADLEQRIRKGVVELQKDQPNWLKPAA
ncbi:MAG TPA: CvpA family protein [Acidobacteriaceae bacterium]|jgi:membrane protein required for colicin V production|nr:CvpA family protein [Acidobacteriaceae bacterium]